MRLAELEQRVRTLEVRLANPKPGNQCSGFPEGPSTEARLEELMRHIWWIKKRVEAAGDLRLALACIREASKLLELAAKLRGEFQETSYTNIPNVHLDPEVGMKIAQLYLDRHKSLVGDSQ